MLHCELNVIVSSARPAYKLWYGYCPSVLHFRTFKKECPANFTLSAQRHGNAQFLRISSHVGEHNHAVDADTYVMYPSVRRLDIAEREHQAELVWDLYKLLLPTLF